MEVVHLLPRHARHRIRYHLLFRAGDEESDARGKSTTGYLADDARIPTDHGHLQEISNIFEPGSVDVLHADAVAHGEARLGDNARPDREVSSVDDDTKEKSSSSRTKVEVVNELE